MKITLWRSALLLAAGIALTTTAHAQSGAKARKAAPAAAAVGTFQIIPLTYKRQIALTTDILPEIERRRRDDQEVEWQVSPYAKVRILSRRTINAPGFRPLPPNGPVSVNQ